MAEADVVAAAPAFTIVAAWISAEMGVGASIASGSQVWKGNWADFAAAAARNPNPIHASSRGGNPFARAMNVGMSKLPTCA